MNTATLILAVVLVGAIAVTIVCWDYFKGSPTKGDQKDPANGQVTPTEQHAQSTSGEDAIEDAPTEEAATEVVGPELDTRTVVVLNCVRVQPAPCKASEVAKITDIGVSTVRRSLKELHSHGLVERVGEGNAKSPYQWTA